MCTNFICLCNVCAALCSERVLKQTNLFCTFFYFNKCMSKDKNVMSIIIDTTTANFACIPIFQRHSIQSAFQCSTKEAATETRTKAIKCHFISLQ